MDNLRFQFLSSDIGLVSKNRNLVKKSLTFDRIVISNILKLSYIYINLPTIIYLQSR